MIYQDPQAANAEHHGGALNFGNDGKLYVTTGEHFNPDAAQSLTSPRGKVLRFNTDGTGPDGQPLLRRQRAQRGRHLGPRPAQPLPGVYDRPTGRLYIGDVGGNDYSTAQEEVHLGVARRQLRLAGLRGLLLRSQSRLHQPALRLSATTGGMRRSPAASSTAAASSRPSTRATTSSPTTPRTGSSGLTLDAKRQRHRASSTSSRRTDRPTDPTGDIVYLCRGAGRRALLRGSRLLGHDGPGRGQQDPAHPVHLQQPAAGRGRLRPADGGPGAADRQLLERRDVGSRKGIRSRYLWTFGDGATSTAANPVHTYVANGAYTARLTVSDGSNTTLSPPITISVGNRPVPTILTPANGSVVPGGRRHLLQRRRHRCRGRSPAGQRLHAGPSTSCTRATSTRRCRRPASSPGPSPSPRAATTSTATPATGSRSPSRIRTGFRARSRCSSTPTRSTWPSTPCRAG